MSKAMERIGLGLGLAAIVGIFALANQSDKSVHDKIEAQKYQSMQTMQYEVERARMLGLLPVGETEYERTKSMVYWPRSE